MPKRDDERHYASTPMGEMFRAGFEPIRTFFNRLSCRAESAFWKMNGRLHHGVSDDADASAPKNKTDIK
jgi:hypothetical protein